MGNYMSAEPPQTPWPILHQEVIQLGEDFEVEYEDTKWARLRYERCRKNPSHKGMTAVSEFCLEDIPAPWRDPIVYNVIMRISRLVVKITVGYVSPNRPDNYHLSGDRGKSTTSCGSGHVCNIRKVSNQSPIHCPIENCDRPGPHTVTPIFEVNTANHVVYDDIEAKKASLTFFYDASDTETVKGEVLDVIFSIRKSDVMNLRCVSHDLELFDKIMKFPIIPPIPSHPLPRQHPIDPLVVIVSHPHGYYKHVSFGEWVGYKDTLWWDLSLSTKYDTVEASLSRDKKEKIVNSKKVSDLLTQTKLIYPTFRETGVYTDNICSSPEYYRQMEQAVQDNPNVTFGEFCEGPVLSHTMSFITYTAATCPGSSGALVFVYFDKGDGTIADGLYSTHFRHFTKRQIANQHINASGFAAIQKDNSELVEQHRQSLTEEK